MVPHNKVTIVEVGEIGMSCAVAIFLKKLTCHLALVDEREAKVIGEAMDLLHGSAFIGTVDIRASKSYDVTAHSELCIITSSVESIPDESNMDFINRYIEIYKGIIPNLVKYSPHTKILVIASPIEILTWAAWKISRLPKTSIFGIDPNLHVTRLLYNVAKEYEVRSSNIDGWVFGNIPILSSLNLIGNILPYDPVQISEDEEPTKIFEKWSIGLKCAQVVGAILKNTNQLLSLTICSNGQYEISRDTFLSSPCLIGKNGVTDVIKQSLSESELALLNSAVEEIEKIKLKILLYGDFINYLGSKYSLIPFQTLRF